MSQTIIDSKSERHSYKVFFTQENIRTILSLVYMGNNNFAINYNSWFSGVKAGHVQGGPIAISGNTRIKANNNPDVLVTVSNFNSDLQNHSISLHITINVNIPMIGPQIIYNQTLGGYYTPSVVR
ncbi:hypothetical protein [Clostridium cellulovorans]|uniref:Uncharacterized protein n=1 Tax=Clostridium cellulovorans (strain ATCC 35296 / DSM 3052 / OCM 3 / 743B) TaxID=573061 RepID=D9SUH2_CLOC7|nr:hypothetical protein [Clostridium cellulovorans]ADL52927.1 hypothetical protein Clocel_3241 [Clostridium cellulovorans 743B]